MKEITFQRINHSIPQPLQFSTSGIRVWDEKNNEYTISLDNQGNLVIHATDGKLSIQPMVANEVAVSTKK